MDVIIVILIVVVVFLTILLLLSESAVVRSGKFTVNDSKGNLYYYLPKGLIKITSVAEVMIYTEKERDQIKGMQLLSQSFVHETEIIPDASQILSLNYVNNVLYRDEIDIKINEKGLITNVDIETEDRLPNIIEALAQAPEKIFTLTQMKKGEYEEKIDIDYIVTTEKFTRVFIFEPSDLPEKANWIIPKKDQYGGSMQVDASFTIKVHLPELKVDPGSFSLKEAVDGIVSRPMILHKFVIAPYAQELNNQEVEFYESLPDTNLNFIIPIKRALFSKVNNNMLFSNGLIMGYKMEKPSEVEGFISIPVNIAKAIISIPTQLFQFRIDTTKRKTELEKEVLNLNKAVSEKEQYSLLQAMENHKKQLEMDKSLLTFEKELGTLKNEIALMPQLSELENQKKLHVLQKDVSALANETKLQREKQALENEQTILQLQKQIDTLKVEIGKLKS